MASSFQKGVRRFYQAVTVANTVDGFSVELDKRTAKTPTGQQLILPTNGLAQHVANEWRNQATFVDYERMPFTRLAALALGSNPAVHSDLARRVVEYAADDLLCYFADAPATLVRRQQSSWEPLLDWVNREMGFKFLKAVGVGHVDQPTQTLAAIEKLAMGLTDFELTGLAAAAQLFGSAILALALMKRRIAGDEAFAVSQIDESFQAETWGEDAEAKGRAMAMLDEASALDRWFEALA